MKWQISLAQSLHIKQWDDEAVVYDAQSGNTHLLGAAAMEVLAELLKSSQDVDALAQVLSSGEENPPVIDVKEKLEAILSQLAGISLISLVAH